MATHPGFAESAVEAVKRWEFIPASQGGQPVEATRRWTVHFFAPVGEVNLKQADDVAHQTQPLIEVAAAGSFDAKLKLTESLDNAEDLMWEGQMEQAILELDLAIAAAPKSGLAYLMRGKAEMSLGKMNEAAADINSAIPLNPKAEGPIISRGVWNQSMGNLEAALADYDRSLKMISGDSNRAWVLRSLVLRKLNRTEAADALASQRAKWGNSWASELADYLLGQITEDELLQRAGEGGPDLAPGRLTEAHYYVGVDLLLKHDPQLARQHFETCLSLNQSNYAEWPLATAELAALR
jgi:tetratricopeptide (TPR) repeat protein